MQMRNVLLNTLMLRMKLMVRSFQILLALLTFFLTMAPLRGPLLQAPLFFEMDVLIRL